MRKKERAWRIFVSLCIAMLLPLTAALGAPLSSDGSPIVLSEMTVDVPPGTEGSWVELYNRSSRKVPMEGLTLVCNGRRVFSFPKDLMLPPKGLVVVNFTRGGTTHAVDDSLRRRNSMTIQTAPLSREKEGPPERKPGYVALFAGKQLKKNDLLAYLRWGQSSTDKPHGEHFKWAVNRELWLENTALYVGLSSGPGKRIFQSPVIATRLMFSAVRNPAAVWYVKSEELATPGRGNPVPSPKLMSPAQGRTIMKEDQLTLSWWKPSVIDKIPEHYKEKAGKQRKPSTRIQIASDPHFRHVCYDEHVPSGTVLDEDVLEPGRYFARIKQEFGPVSTDWSRTSFFKYHPSLIEKKPE